MSEQNKRLPIQMDFAIASITEGIEYWLNEIVLKENIVVDKVEWQSNKNKFSVTFAKKKDVK